MISLLSETYQGAQVSFRAADGYINATEMAKAVAGEKKPKAPAKFLSAESTRRFQHALVEDLGKMQNSILPIVKLVEVHHGGIAPGTWMHPDLAVEFARWLSPEFAIWTNRIVRRVMSGQSLNETVPQQVSAQLSRIFDALAALAESHVKLANRVTAIEEHLTTPTTRPALPFREVGGRPRRYLLCDFIPRLVEATGSEDQRQSFCDLARATGTTSRGSFAAMLADAVALGLAQKHEDGRYYAKAPNGAEVAP